MVTSSTWRRFGDWLLPTALAALQLASWQYWTAIGPVPAGRLSSAVAGLALVLTTVALASRRRSPVAAAAGALAGLIVAELAVAPDTFTVAWLNVPIALYSVAVHRSGRVTAITAGFLVVTEALPLPGPTGWSALRPAEVVLTAAVYAVISALGRRRRTWRRTRQEIADRINRAESDKRRLAIAERDRLARELHDVTAHHLTAVVVTATAAGRLADRRPELTAEALEFAATTGRRTVEALHRLVDVVGSGDAAEPLPTRLARLAVTADRAGQRLTLAVDDPDGTPPAVAEVVYATVREALTNALRHAPGAPVTATVSRRDGLLTVAVENAAADDDGNGHLGSGRGLAGLGARITDLGGTLTTGPLPGGGWSVRATLPVDPADAAWEPARLDRWLASMLRIGWLGHAVIIILVGAPALATVYGLRGGDAELGVDPLTRPAMVLVVLVVAARTAALFWRRDRPWPVLAVVCATATVPALVDAFAEVPGGMSLFLFVSATAECVAVYTVAARARPKWLTAGAVLPAALGLSVAVIADIDGSHLGARIVMAGCLAVVLAFVFVPLWGIGAVVRGRRDRVRAADSAALAAASHATAQAVDAQRRRVATALRTSVVDSATRLVIAAEDGRTAVAEDRLPDALEGLVRVSTAARAGLAAMRELLQAIHPDSGEDQSPQPGIDQLDRLCARYRAAGRKITLRLNADRAEAPLAVDVSAYRLISAALDAGDTGAAEVVVDDRPEALRITIRGVPSAAAGGTAARLRARVAALDGTLSVRSPGVLDIVLPTRSEPTGSEPGAATPSQLPATPTHVPAPSGPVPAPPREVTSSTNG